jgi:segregation and condensation protein B
MIAIDNDASEPASELPEAVRPETVDRAPEDRRENLRMIEALVFASAEPLSAEELATRLPEGAEIHGLLRELQQMYAPRGVNLVQVAGKWAFRTAGDLSFLLAREAVEQRRMSRAALETLAIIAYHQPVTRADIEEIRGVATSTGTLDVLLESGWIRMRGRRKTPGRPITYGTTEAFLSHFGLDAVGDLPGVEELKAAGLLDSRVPPGFSVPEPSAGEELAADEDPLDAADLAAEGE